MRRLVVLMLVVAGIAACGSSSGPGGPTASSVSVQSGDVPKGMVRCDLSGDIQSFIQKEGGADPTTSKTAQDQWSTLQKAGATSGYVTVYTDSKTHCTDFASSRTDPAAANYKLIVNFTVQFKDEKSASAAYTNGSIFGVSSSSLSGPTGVVGAKTGLTANSVVVSQAIGNQSFYIALWQDKAFAIFLAAVNLDPASSKKVATSEDARIK